MTHDSGATGVPSPPQQGAAVPQPRVLAPEESERGGETIAPGGETTTVPSRSDVPGGTA